MAQEQGLLAPPNSCLKARMRARRNCFPTTFELQLINVQCYDPRVNDKPDRLTSFNHFTLLWCSPTGYIHGNPCTATILFSLLVMPCQFSASGEDVVGWVKSTDSRFGSGNSADTPSLATKSPMLNNIEFLK